MSNIKLGVSLYCFTKEYVDGTYTLEDCIEKARQMDVDGYEIVATQMIDSYPSIDEVFLGRITSANQQYGMKTISYGANMDRGMRCDRDLNEDEMVQMTIQDIRCASRLGCRVMRAQFLLSPQALVRVAPYAEAYNVKVGIEIHNPETPSTPIMMEYYHAIVESGSKYIGFIVDFGSFATKPNKPNYDEALANGASKEILDRIADCRLRDVGREIVLQELQKRNAPPAAYGAFEAMYGFLAFSAHPDYEGLRRIMPYVFHFHGKFHAMLEDGSEASIPYPELLKVIYESDYEGYIVSEYEDHVSGNALAMTQKHIAMEKRILKELEEGGK